MLVSFPNKVVKSFEKHNVDRKLSSGMGVCIEATIMKFLYPNCQGCGGLERSEMGSKNSPNSARLLWQIGSRTVKREKRPPRLIERKKEGHAGFELFLSCQVYP